MRFRELGGYLKKSWPRGKYDLQCCSKGILGGVGCQQPWGCISEDWTAVMDTQYRLLPPSPSPHPLPHGSWTDRLTQTHSIAEAFDATCSLEACQPAYLLRPLAKVHTQPSLLATEAGIWELISSDESEGSPWLPSWEIVVGCFFLLGLYWQEKREQEANLFFCFGNWVWHALLSKCYPFKHFRGKLVAPASISVMWPAIFSPDSLLYDEKTTPRFLRLWHIEDESTLHFCANWEGLCRIWQHADISFSERFGFEIDLGLQ